jgi:hypothetical protein
MNDKELTTIPKAQFDLMLAQGNLELLQRVNHMIELLEKHFEVDVDREVEYCPKCNAEWSGTSCGLDDCGWIVGGEE